MKNYIRCPKCRKFSLIARRLHASWTCPNCHTGIVPRKERVFTNFRVKSILNKKNNTVN